MSDVDQFQEFRDSIKQLIEINNGVVESLKMLSVQNSAFSHAISILSVSMKSQGINISEDFIEIGIKNLRENYGLNPSRDKFIRDMLFGNPLSAPVIPAFTVIRGGKDDPAPDPTEG